MNNLIISTTFGLIGTILWSFQLLPQCIKSFREKSTKGLSPWMMLSWYCSALPFSVFLIKTSAPIPLQIQPFLFGVLCLICYLQTVYYPDIMKLKTLLHAALLIMATSLFLPLGIYYFDDLGVTICGHLSIAFHPWIHSSIPRDSWFAFILIQL